MTSRTRSLALALAAVVFNACTSTPSWPPPDTYFIGTEHIRMDRKYLNRYACANGAPLTCRCTSILIGRCDCHC